MLNRLFNQLQKQWASKNQPESPATTTQTDTNTKPTSTTSSNTGHKNQKTINQVSNMVVGSNVHFVDVLQIFLVKGKTKPQKKDKLKNHNIKHPTTTAPQQLVQNKPDSATPGIDFSSRTSRIFTCILFSDVKSPVSQSEDMDLSWVSSDDDDDLSSDGTDFEEENLDSDDDEVS
jgi:hypothetical protein